MNRIIKAAAIAVIAGIGVIGTTAAASAASITKTETITVVDTPAWTEHVKVVDEAAWTETVVPAKAAIWASFNPTNPKKFTGTPTYPTDSRGTWVEGVMPDGHKGTDGVYQKGGGNGTWFYRHAAVPATTIDHAEVSHIEDVQHPAVTHQETTTSVLTDTNNQVASFDPATATGIASREAVEATLGKDADLSKVTFTTQYTNHKDESWQGTDGTVWHAYMDVRMTYTVKATPILGDVTGEIVGWTLNGIDKNVSYDGGERTGTWPVGTITNGAGFAGFLPTTFTNTYANLKVNGNAL